MLKFVIVSKFIAVAGFALPLLMSSARAQPAALAPVGDRGFVYALVNNGAAANNQIYGYSFDPADGSLTALAGFPVSTGSPGDLSSFTGLPNVIPERLTYDPVNNRLFALNGSRTLSVFRVNPTSGALALTPYSPIAIGSTQPICVRVNKPGTVAVVGSASGLNGAGTLRSYVVSSDAAIQAVGSPYDIGSTQPYSCAFSHDGKYFYTGGGDLNANLAGIDVNSSTGVLTALSGSPFNAGTVSPHAFATDPNGRLFVSSGTFGSVGTFAYTTIDGIPSGVTGNPFSPLIAAGEAVMHPAGLYMVADQGGSLFSDSNGQIHVYKVSGTGSATSLTYVSGSPFATDGKNSASLVLSGGGGFLIAANAATRNLTVFSVNSSTGVLTKRTLQPADAMGLSGRLNGLAFSNVRIDIDGDTRYAALTDGLLILRYLSGLTGNSLTSGAIGSLPARGTPSEVSLFLDTIRPALDVDGNGNFDASTDGLLILRYLLGLRGPGLTAGALGAGATRSGAQIETYIQSIIP